MSNINEITNLPAASKPIAEKLQKRSGRLLNIHARMALSPVVVAAYAGMTDAIAEYGTFDARTRETIALAVGNQNGCEYCQAAHTASARRTGLTDEQIVQIRTGEITFDARLAAIAEIARNAAADTGNVDPAVRQNALDAGWSEEQLEELFAHIAANLYTNYFNHYAGTELDFPPAVNLD